MSREKEIQWIKLDPKDMPRNILDTDIYEYRALVAGTTDTYTYYHASRELLELLSIGADIQFSCKRIEYKSKWSQSPNQKSFRESLSHPSFAKVSISNVSGGGRLFGSEIMNEHYVSLKISRNEYQRELSNDWYAEKETYIEVNMSANQWAELLTTGFSSSGVPATLRYKEGMQFSMPVMKPKSEVFEDEVDKTTEGSLDFIKGIREILEDKKTLTIKTKDELKSLLNQLENATTGNKKFVLKQFKEAMDKVVVEAKASIDQSLLHAVTKTGLQVLTSDKGIQLLQELNSDSKELSDDR